MTDSNFSIVDVYKIAASIGQELEVLIEKCGPDAVAGFMPKIISCLEQFEIVTKKYENHNVDIEEWAARLERLQSEFVLNQEERIKLNKLQLQLERLIKVNQDLRRKQAFVQSQSTSLIDQKVELEAQIQTLQQEINLPKQEVNQNEETVAVTATKEMKPEINMDGKQLIDLKDPNRPRFTKSELVEVLTQRDNWKARVFELEEELKTLKADVEIEKDYVVVVDGPSERKEAVHHESGIRKLFRFFGHQEKKKQEDRKPAESESRKKDGAKKESDEAHNEIVLHDSDSSSENKATENPAENPIANTTNDSNANVTINSQTKSGKKQKSVTLSGFREPLPIISPEYENVIPPNPDSLAMADIPHDSDWRKNRPHDFLHGMMNLIV
uniref:RILP-like protein 1-like n=1 Tax=Saccoglossus kowalevskii TaxID=10224 RepID=A0ABM0MJE0_SACKO|nr:PREDICTED: RILP-like protein 1-like [Saccoglossus kowalevskii]